MSFGHSKFFCCEFSVQISTPFFTGLIRVLVSSFLSSLYILGIRPLSDEGFVKIFSQTDGSLFVLLTVSFALQKLNEKQKEGEREQERQD